jgi:hypothetical protein
MWMTPNKNVTDETIFEIFGRRPELQTLLGGFGTRVN